MSHPSLQDAFLPHTDTLFRELNDEAVLLHLGTGTYFGLNAVGTRMWQLIGRHSSLRLVLDELEREYDVPKERLERDLLEMVAQLSSVQLVVRQPATSATPVAGIAAVRA